MMESSESSQWAEAALQTMDALYGPCCLAAKVDSYEERSLKYFAEVDEFLNNDDKRLEQSTGEVQETV